MTSRDKIYSQLAQIALNDFADIVEGTKVVEGKLRVFLKDESFIDVWLSVKKKGVYAYHWERGNVDGTIYRLIISLTKRLKSSQRIQSISIMEPRRM